MAENAEWKYVLDFKKRKKGQIINDDSFPQVSSNVFEVTGFRSASIVRTYTYVYETYRIVYSTKYQCSNTVS
jgi:hypothetical protein